jgi:TolB-like protein/DNA-binding winged helix-turn-helix (wHTH) protein/Tfp pilus assembly protein PilF
MAQPLPTYRFGPYELRTQSRELFKLGTKLRLRPQSYQVLQLLVEHAGDAVSREELHRALWPQAATLDFELGLNTCIKELRGLLSDSATEPRYIQTLPKVGYRMIRAVSLEPVFPPEEPTVGADDRSPETPPRPVILGGSQSRVVAWNMVAWKLVAWKWLAATTVALAFLASLGYLQWSRSRRVAQAPPVRTILAVLPFDNLTGDPSQDYFSDGLTEEMITQLGRLDPQHLGLIARTSAMHYKNDRQGLVDISKELGVQYVLQGSVRRDAGKVRITAELIQTKDQTHLWSQEYDRELSSLLALQSEISQEIAREIKITLHQTEDSAHVSVGASSTALSPNAYQAYDLYLEGRYFWNKRTGEGLKRAVDYFQQSIDADPTYARSYAGLADNYAMMSAYGVMPANEATPKARAAAQRAIQLDNHLAEAHVSLAVIAQNYDWDWATAETEYRRAIEFDPNYATAHHWYAEYLALTGRFDEALVEIERARQLDPLSLIIAADRGTILYFSRQYDLAIAQFHSVLEMEPAFPRANMVIYAYVQQGEYSEALADIAQVRKLGDASWISLIDVYVLGRSGQREEAQRELDRLGKVNAQESPLAIAIAYLGLGNNEQTFAWMEKAYAAHTTSLAAIKVDPTFDPLRGDPRFQNLLHRLGLQP